MFDFDYFLTPHVLSGIKKIEDVEMSRGVFLQASGMEPDVHISMLSDGDISEVKQNICSNIHAVIYHSKFLTNLDILVLSLVPIW